MDSPQRGGENPAPTPVPHRRAFLRLSAMGLVGVTVARARAASPPTAGMATAGALAAVPTTTIDGAWLFAPLSGGSQLGFGWMYARSFPVRDGGITVNLVHRDGRAARIDVCLLDQGGRGPAHSGLCDFIVMDGGNGDAPMDEELGRAVARLAAVVSDNETSHPDAIRTLLALEPHAERVWRHREGMEVAAFRLAPGSAADPA